MRALVRDSYGPPDVLKVEEVEAPTIGDDDVLVRVRASSINAGDRLLLQGEPYLVRLMSGLFRPKKRGVGQDVAGTVEAVGSAVADLKPGDDVFGEIAFGGTWAEYAVGPAAVLARKPDGLSFEGAGSLPVAAMTALDAVRDQAAVQPGQRVLINGASGGVGSYAVQIAKAYGAEVTAVCSARNREAALQLGADHVIDYRNEDFLKTDQRYDAVLDVAGSRPLRQTLGILVPEGTYVAVGGPVDLTGLGFIVKMLYRMVLGWVVPQSIKTFVSGPGRANLEALGTLFEQGKLVPVITATCGLDDVPGVIASMLAGEQTGKVVVQLGAANGAS